MLCQFPMRHQKHLRNRMCLVKANLVSLSYIQDRTQVPRARRPCSAIHPMVLERTNGRTSRVTMPCSMSDFMSPDRASRSGARARGGLNDRRVTTSKPGWKWRRGVCFLFNQHCQHCSKKWIAFLYQRGISQRCPDAVAGKLANPRQTLPPYMHSGMKSGLPAFCELICATKT